jgi:hypothetical protein
LQIEAKNINPNGTLLQVQLRTKIRASMPKNNIESTLNYQGRLLLPLRPFKVPLINVKHLNLEGELILQNTTINQIKISNMNTQVTSNSTELRLNPFNCTLYNGNSVGDLNYQFASNRLTINQTGTNLNANALLMDLFEKNIIKGSLDFSLHASTQLQDQLWRNTLQGNGTLSIKDGELFMNLYESINNAVNTVSSLLSDNNDKLKQALQDPLYAPKVPEPGSTSFQWFNLQYTLKDGKFLADSLSLQTPKIQITGKGNIDMNDTSQQIDLQAKILGDHNVVDKIQTMIGGSIPITITGSVLKPMISTNLKGISQLLSRYLLKTTVQKPINAVGKHLNNLLIAPDDLTQNNQQ